MLTDLQLWVEMTITITLETFQRYTGGIEGTAQNQQTRHSTGFRCSVVSPSCSMLSVRSKMVVLGSPPHTERQTLMEANPEIRTTALHGLAVV